MRIRSRVSAAAIKAIEAGKLPAMTEDELQSQIVAVLRLCGYVVLVTSRRRKRCVHCGKVSHSGDGADKGAPDLFVSAPWMGWQWVGMEVKREGRVRWSSPEQKSLWEKGRICVVQSVEDAKNLMERTASWPR